MAQTNKKNKRCTTTTCPGCQPPKKFVFQYEGSFELPAYWNADVAEDVLSHAIDKALDSMVGGRLRNEVQYTGNVFEDK